VRNRYLLALGALSVAFPIVVFVLPRLFMPHIPHDTIGDDTGWSPTPSEIAAAVSKSGPGDFRDSRHAKFAELFKSRYRRQQKAVGIRFDAPGHLKIMFAALTPRWDMAHVSVEAAREATSCFGVPFQLDVYETFISSPELKLAEVRQDAGNSPISVWFDQRFTQDSVRLSKRRWSLFRSRNRTMRGSRLRNRPFARPLIPAVAGPSLMLPVRPN